MTWFDHETGSVWSQVTGTALLGPLEGTSIPLLSSELANWSDWREQFPETQALATGTGSNTFAVRHLTVVAQVIGETAGLKFVDLADAGSLSIDLGGEPVVFVADPNIERWAVFSRVVNSEERHVERNGDQLVDVDTGEAWSVSTGASFDGLPPLERVPTFSSNFANFVDIFPDGRVLVEPEFIRPIPQPVIPYIR